MIRLNKIDLIGISLLLIWIICFGVTVYKIGYKNAKDKFYDEPCKGCVEITSAGCACIQDCRDCYLTYESCAGDITWELSAESATVDTYLKIVDIGDDYFEICSNDIGYIEPFDPSNNKGIFPGGLMYGRIWDVLTINMGPAYDCVIR